MKGDVHDIGKNLVEIILKNNGFDVINLGIKVPPEVLIAAFKEHKPDAIGLSGLLVKSAQQMVITAADLREAGIHVPLLVGGAALSEKFTRTKIAPSYSASGLLRERRDVRSAPDESSLTDPARAKRCCASTRSRTAPADGGSVAAVRAPVKRRALAESAHGSADSARGLSGPQSARGSGS